MGESIFSKAYKVKCIGFSAPSLVNASPINAIEDNACRLKGVYIQEGAYAFLRFGLHRSHIPVAFASHTKQNVLSHFEHTKVGASAVLHTAQSNLSGCGQSSALSATHPPCRCVSSSGWPSNTNVSCAGLSWYLLCHPESHITKKCRMV